MTTFIDLFAGLGGFRIGMTNVGFTPAWGSDFNKNAADNYMANFGEDIHSDITEVDERTIPDFSVLCAGFPCQPFSKAVAGALGFEDTRGTLFFDIMRIVEHHQPPVLFLENVKNLVSHDKGRTFSVMLKHLETAGYDVSYEILNAVDYGVPQSRERIIIVASKLGRFDFSKVRKVSPRRPLKDYLDTIGEFDWLDEDEYVLLRDEDTKQQPRTGLKFVGYRKANMRTNGVRDNTAHLSRAHRQANRIYSDEGSYSTLSSQETAGRYYVLTDTPDGGRGVRRLTMGECFRIFGFPDSYEKVGSTADLYNRIGNSIVIPVVSAVAVEIKNQLF